MPKRERPPCKCAASGLAVSLASFHGHVCETCPPWKLLRAVEHSCSTLQLPLSSTYRRAFSWVGWGCLRKLTSLSFQGIPGKVRCKCTRFDFVFDVLP